MHLYLLSKYKQDFPNLNVIAMCSFGDKTVVCWTHCGSKSVLDCYTHSRGECIVGNRITGCPAYSGKPTLVDSVGYVCKVWGVICWCLCCTTTDMSLCSCVLCEHALLI